MDDAGPTSRPATPNAADGALGRNFGQLLGRHGVSMRHLEIFWAVMRSGSQAAAAEMLGVSQPAISKMLKYIEQRTRMTLFQKNRGRMSPTVEADILYKAVDEIFERVIAAERLVDDLRHRVSGQISVAFMPGLGSRFVSEVLVAFAREAPDAKPRVKLLPPSTIADRAAKNEIDVGLLYGPLEDAAVRTEVLREAHVVCVLPAGHRLCGLAEVTPSDLVDERLISGAAAGATSWMHGVHDAFIAEGLSYDLAVACFHSAQAYDLVSAGLGVALVPPLFAPATQEANVVVRPFSPQIASPLLAMTPADPPPTQAASELLRTLRKMSAEPG